jgi:hypothetical protein
MVKRPMAPTPPHIAEQVELEVVERVNAACKRHREIRSLQKKLSEEELDTASFRDLAAGTDAQFNGTDCAILVEQKSDTICRVVLDDAVPRVDKLAGENRVDLFSYHPSKGNEKSFELNALKLLRKRAAQNLIDLLTVPATAWVKFL